MFSLNLTIHNKDFLIESVLNGIIQNTKGKYELIVALDGCTDQSEFLVKNFLKNTNIKYKILYANNIFETRSNNLAAKNSSEDYIIIIQDDMVIKEEGWNLRLVQPIKKFDDIFAVTARTAHSWKINENSKDIHLLDFELDRWPDILIHINHADKNCTERDIFAIRDSVNRGPLLLKHEIFKKLNYFDEIYAPLDMDEHDLCYRAKSLGYKSGFYSIDYVSQPEWGGTRENGKTKTWMFQANFKNSKVFIERHKSILMNAPHLKEDRRMM
jgi:GT2 family glycosyltransferase